MQMRERERERARLEGCVLFVDLVACAAAAAGEAPRDFLTTCDDDVIAGR